MPLNISDLFMINIYRRKLTARERIFLLAVVLKILVQLLSISVVPFMIGTEITSILFKVMTYGSYILILYLFVTSTDFSLKEIVMIGGLLFISLIGSYFAGNDIMLTLIYIYGAKNVNIEEVFTRVGIIYIVVSFSIVYLSFVGIVENWDFFRTTVRQRWGLGYSYPTHTSSVEFIAILILCYLLKEKLNIFWVFIIEILNFWMFKYTDSRAGFYLSILVPILFWGLKFKKKATYNSIFDWFVQWAFPICAVTIFCMTKFYNNSGILKHINKILSSRLSISQSTMEKYGIHLFGQIIQYVGWGGIGHTTTELSGTYDYVDTSYIKLMLDNGIIVWCLIMLGWTIISIYSYKKNDKYLLYAIAVIAVYCMVEQWLMNLGANPFVIFLAYYVFWNKKEIKDSPKCNFIKNRYVLE